MTSIKTALLASSILLVWAAPAVEAQVSAQTKISSTKVFGPGPVDPAVRDAALRPVKHAIAREAIVDRTTDDGGASDKAIVDDAIARDPGSRTDTPVRVEDHAFVVPEFYHPPAVLASCGQGAAPAPYDQPYNHLNSSGTLDVKLVHDNVIGSVRSFQQSMDDLQARTEQLRCEQSNTQALLASLGHAVDDCPMEPAIPYDTNIPLRVADGFADITAVIATTQMYRRNASDVLGDLQSRVQRLHCAQARSAKASGDLLAGVSSMSIQPTPPPPCARAAPSPSYIQHYIHESASGVMDYKMAINVLSADQASMEGWLDDIQSRLGQIDCEQSNVNAQVRATLHARNKASQLLALARTGTDRAGLQRESPRELAAGVLQRPDGATEAGHAGGALERAQAHPSVSVSQASPQPAKPTDRDCSKLVPDPSYVADVRHWSCSTAEACTPYDEFTMNLVADMRRDTQAAADDLQVRVNRLVCQQRNINGQLGYLYAADHAK